MAHRACAPAELNAAHNSSAMHRKTISAREVDLVLTAGIVLEESTLSTVPLAVAYNTTGGSLLQWVR